MSNEGLTLYLGAFVDELVRSGINHIVVSPGSRSTPIAVLAAEHPKLKVWMHVDERSAAFFALGIAKKQGEAVAILCTSGTAAANYYPTIAEANLSRVPLVVLTADRPHELRDVGAPQTIDQLNMFGSHAKWFMEMPLPEATPKMIQHARMMAARATMTAQLAPRGVVHLNFPLREPLLPNLEHPELFKSGRRADNAYVQTYKQEQAITQQALEQITSTIMGAGKVLIIAGPHDDAAWTEAITALAEQLHAPVLADPLSHLRNGSHAKTHIIDSYDSLLRLESIVDELQPDLLIRLGAMPISKPLLQYMNKYTSAEHIVVDQAGWRDPTLLVSHYVIADPIVFCNQVSGCVATSAATSPESNDNVQDTREKWLTHWQQLEQYAEVVLNEAIWADNQEHCFEGSVVGHLQQLMQAESTLFVSNSMPIRDVDSFWRKSDKSLTIMANRGANGIDGVVSSALGASIAQRGNVLLIGDLSFYHDLNGLLAAKLYALELTIVVINNDGGGIFSFLPQAGLPQHFETLFGTPIGLNYEHAALMYGGQFQRVKDWDAFTDAFTAAQNQGGLQIIEITTDRHINVELHRNIWPKLEQCITGK